MSIRFCSVPIDEIRDETPDTYSLFFQNPDPDLFRYKAGQYLTVRVEIEGLEYRRAFSLASSPFVDERLQLTIKRVEGGLVSNYLRDHCKKGDLLALLPPMGHYTFVPEPARRRDYVLVGAGSGITPLMSILKTILRMEEGSKVHLWYGNRNEADIIFREELIQLRTLYGERLQVRHSLSQADYSWTGLRGRLTEDRIFEWLSDLFMEGELRKQYYLCGPSAMMEAAEQALLKQAVYPEDIHQEFYHAPLPTEEEIALSVNVNGNGQNQKTGKEPEQVFEARSIVLELDGETHHLTVEAGEYILDAAIRADLDPPYSCRSGVCTSCIAKLKKGKVVMDQSLGLTASEREADYVLTCQCHPLDDEVEVVFD